MQNIRLQNAQCTHNNKLHGRFLDEHNPKRYHEDMNDYTV